MPTPIIYSRLGNYGKRFRTRLAVITFGLIAFAVLAVLALFIQKVVPVAICMPLIVWSWGVVVAVHWFRDDGALQRIKSPMLGIIARWLGAVALTIWFLSPIALPFVFI